MKKTHYVPGQLISGNFHQLRENPLGFLYDAQSKFGPIFKLRFYAKRTTVVCGGECIKILTTDLAKKLNRNKLFIPFAKQVGLDIFAANETSHQVLSELIRLPYSRELAETFVPEFLEVIAQALSRLNTQVVDLFSLTKDISLKLAIKMITPYQIDDSIDDFKYAGGEVMFVQFGLKKSYHFLKPKYRSSHKRIGAVIDNLIQLHRSEKYSSEKKYIIDACIDSKLSNGSSMSDRAIRGTCFYAIAGSEIYIGRLAGFMLYEILKDEQLLSLVLDEIKSLFDTDTDEQKFRIARTPILYAAFRETLRLYPLLPGLPYNTSEDILISGHLIKKNSRVLFVPHLSNFLDENYPDAKTFNYNRYLSNGRSAPHDMNMTSYGVGNKMCKAQGMNEILTLSIVIGMLKNQTIDLLGQKGPLKLRLNPLIEPQSPMLVKVSSKT